MIRLVLIDVDGTLFGPNGVPECAWAAAKKAVASGLHLALCTGRPGRGRALEYAAKIDPAGLHIFESGAVVLRGNGSPEKVTPLPEAVYRRLLGLSREHSVPFEAYTADGGYYREEDHPDLLAHERMLGYGAVVEPMDDLPGIIVRAQFVPRPGYGWEVVRNAVLGMAEVELHEATSPGVPGVGFNSVTTAGVSKLEAARWMAGRFGYGLENVMMVGDGENDLELIRAAGLGVAMGNAPAVVKAGADRIVADVEGCGLAEALELALGS